MALLTRRGFAGGIVAAGAATVIGVVALRKPGEPPIQHLPAPDQPAVAMRPLTDIERVSPPGTLTDAAVTALDGSAKHLPGDWRGRVVVLNFWATWCIPCVAELPALDQLAGTQPDFAVLAVSADRSGGDVVKPFLAAHGISHLTVLLDPHMEAGRAFGVVGFPTTLVIDASGRLRGRLEGPADWASAASVIRSIAA